MRTTSSQVQATVEALEAQISALLAQMTLAEKVGQMTQAEKNSITPDDVTEYAIGSVLSGGGGNPEPNTAATWRQMVVDYQQAALKTRLSIPLIYGSDAVHGHNNVQGATIFPHNIGLGASGDAELVERTAQITAKELLATSVHWNFAPAVSVPRDIRWGRTYEGFSEQTALVREMSMAYVRGLSETDHRVLPSVKHFVADGAAEWESTRSYEWIHGNWQAPDDGFKIDQGDARIDEETLRREHLAPYEDAIKAGALNVMTSFSSWNGEKMHEHRYLVTDVLKGELGFAGFVVSDWMAINQLDSDYYTCVVSSINAGIDMNMVPFDFRQFIGALTRAVENGDVSMSRIDDAVRRILRAKFWLGLFDNPITDAALLDDVGCAAHRATAREAVQKSLVLLKNDNDALPLSKSTERVLLAGRGADDIGMQCGGWTIEWQGGMGDIVDGTTLRDALNAELSSESVIYDSTAEFGDVHAPVGIVAVGEAPYAEGFGDNGHLVLCDEDIAAIEKTRAHCDRLIVVLFSGRPLVITEQVALADAFVVAWWPGTEGAGMTDLLFGDVAFTGKLNHSWPRSLDQLPLSRLKAHDQPPLFPLGHGL
ncbi:MAG: beta-glucosidase [Anaerolineaceae bacterium]|nr:MAG: beta-glucosidase [Anaerolineaceae bacterium]